MKIDRSVAKEISDKIKDFVATLETQYAKRDAGVLTPAEAQYDRMRNACNLPPRGTAIVDAYGEKWVPVEWIIKGRKYNVLAIKVSDGKRYKFTDRSLAVMSRA